MAKQHLVESFSGPRENYKNVTTEVKYAKLLESAKSLFAGKTSLKESNINLNKTKKVLTEAKIDEKTQSEILKGLQEAGASQDVELWQFPISKINTKDKPNLNGRVYGRPLWENVINKQVEVWKGGTGLANHPADDDDGDFMKQSIVWLDGFLGDDDIVYGIGVFVGEGGNLARQIIGVGGKVGFSTSGYGDFLSDGITVDADTYEIERLADLVLNPSQGVFGNYKDSIQFESTQKNKGATKVQESVENKKSKLEEEVISISEENLLKQYESEIETIGKKSNKFWESKVKSLESLVKKVKKENFSTTSKTNLNTKVNSMIESIMKEANSAIEEGFLAKEICEELEIKSLSELGEMKNKLEDFASLEECLAAATKEADKYKKLYEDRENFATKEAEASLEQEELAESLSKEVNSLKLKLESANKKIKDLTPFKEKYEETSKLLENAELESDQNAEDVENLEEELNSIKEENQRYSNFVKQLQEATGLKDHLLKGIKNIMKECGQCKADLESSEEEIEGLNSEIDGLEENVKALKAELLESKSKLSKALMESKALRTQKAKALDNNQELKGLLEESSKTIRDLQKKLKMEESRTSSLNKENSTFKKAKLKEREDYFNGLVGYEYEEDEDLEAAYNDSIYETDLIDTAEQVSNTNTRSTLTSLKDLFN